MTSIDWKRKLTSRKFWAAIASFVSMLIVALGGAESEATQVTALIMAGAAVVAYIVGEGLTDVANAKKADTIELLDVTEAVKTFESTTGNTEEADK